MPNVDGPGGPHHDMGLPRSVDCRARMALTWGELWPVAVLTLQIAVAIDSWVHRQDKQSTALKADIARLDREFTSVWATIHDMGNKMSKFGSDQQAEVLAVGIDIATIKGDLKQIYAMLDRRKIVR